MLPIFTFFKWLAGFTIWVLKFLPMGIVVLITVVTLFNSVIESVNEGDAKIFLKELSITIFSADYQIQKEVNTAKEQPNNFGVFNIFKIISSLLIIYFLTKFIGKVLIGFTGSQATFMAYVFGFLIVCLLELTIVAFVEQEIVFPMSGIWSLVTNLNCLSTGFNPDIFAPLRNKYLPEYQNLTSSNISTNITT